MNSTVLDRAMRESGSREHWLPLPGTALQITGDAFLVDGARKAVPLGVVEGLVEHVGASDPEGRIVSLPTPEMIDLAFRHARFRPPATVVEGLVPAWPGFSYPLPPSRNSLVERSRRIDLWLMSEGWGPNDLVTPIGVHWVIGANGSGPSGYGWEARRGEYHSCAAAGDEDGYLLRLVRWRRAAAENIQHASRRKRNSCGIVELSRGRRRTLPGLRQRHRQSIPSRCRTDPTAERTITAFATSSARSVSRLSSPSWAYPAQPPPVGSAVVADRSSPRSSSPRTNRHSEHES